MSKGKWTQTRLASESGVSRPTIWAILKGEADTTDETVLKLAKAMGVKPPAISSLRVGESRVDYRVEIDDPVEGPGWIWTDEDELEERLRTVIRNVERTARGMVTDQASLRDLQLAVCRGLIKQCELAGRPIPASLQQIYNEVIEGRFK